VTSVEFKNFINQIQRDEIRFHRIRFLIYIGFCLFFLYKSLLTNWLNVPVTLFRFEANIYILLFGLGLIYSINQLLKSNTLNQVIYFENYNTIEDNSIIINEVINELDLVLVSISIYMYECDLPKNWWEVKKKIYFLSNTNRIEYITIIPSPVMNTGADTNYKLIKRINERIDIKLKKFTNLMKRNLLKS